ncbi:MAG: hypothetical protein J6S28_04905, partial [Clostridia bacterium]|nr:hypothetical protein [Clostridia bacterium]
MKRFTLFALCACLLLGVLTCIPVFAMEKEALPSYIFDFTDASLSKQLTGMANMSCNATDGSHYTFTAS